MTIDDHLDSATVVLADGATIAEQRLEVAERARGRGGRTDARDRYAAPVDDIGGALFTDAIDEAPEILRRLCRRDEALPVPPFLPIVHFRILRKDT